ncbi:MAG: gas vesicle protein GvpN [Deltaproteobacteria bacterium]|nr:gas vesicle protein GvpN [Deltaproteobacteria bacterium]
MLVKEFTTVLELEPLPDFVETGHVRDVTERGLAYIEAGFPLHLRGLSGTGKTTIAMHLAAKLGRPIVVFFGDEEYSTSDLVGGRYGYRRRRVVDNFIHSVHKIEEDMRQTWVDNRLTVACKHGFTLIYDEFTRSRPEANNVLLSVLQERMLALSPIRGGDGYMKVHPNFVAIFTSNPEEYAGVCKSQDALRDRMVTIDLDHPDRDTEVAITVSKSGLGKEDAAKIVDVVRALRDSVKCEFSPTVRGCIMIAKTLRIRNAAVNSGDRVFREICKDVLSSETSRGGNKAGMKKVREAIGVLIDRYCSLPDTSALDTRRGRHARTSKTAQPSSGGGGLSG